MPSASTRALEPLRLSWLSILQADMLKVELHSGWGILLPTAALARPLHHNEQHALPTETWPEHAGGDMSDHQGCPDVRRGTCWHTMS